MKTIQVDKGGFGTFSLFSKKSNKKELIKDTTLGGNFLEELDITYKVGDTIKIKIPSRKFANTYSISDIKIYEVTDKLYKAEFI